MRHRRLPRPVVAALAVMAVLGPVAACSSDASDGGRAPGTRSVAASFYPLQWVAEQVGGDRVEVSSLTPPGAEPHDLELSPKDVAKVADSDLVVYLADFQPSVDAAVADTGAKGFDVTDAADLDLTFTPIEEGEQHADEAGATDPHFWLDPTRLAAVGDAVAARLAKDDPAHAATYRANASSLRGRLTALDRELRDGLADCTDKDLVTSHNAFGYLARRYGLEQVGITGLTPEAEPSPKQLAEASDFVEEHDVRTIYFETLVSPRIAETLARETGAKTAVLDPIEGLSDDSHGEDYVEVMQSNLRNLRAGQRCR